MEERDPLVVEDAAALVDIFLLLLLLLLLEFQENAFAVVDGLLLVLYVMEVVEEKKIQ